MFMLVSLSVDANAAGNLTTTIRYCYSGYLLAVIAVIAQQAGLVIGWVNNADQRVPDTFASVR